MNILHLLVNPLRPLLAVSLPTMTLVLGALGMAPDVAPAADLARATGTSMETPTEPVSRLAALPACVHWTRPYRYSNTIGTYGGVCDGSHDDSAAIQAALTAIPCEGGDVIFPAGDCMIDAVAQTLIPRSHTRLLLQPRTVLKAIPNASAGYFMINILSADDVRIEGGTIQGDRDAHTGTTGEWGFGVMITNSRNVRISNVTIRDTWGDGIYVGTLNPNGTSIGYSEDVVIENTRIERARRNGISIGSVKRLVVDGCTIANSGGTAPGAAMDFESENVGMPNVDAIVKNTITYGNASSINCGGEGSSNVFVEGGRFRDTDSILLRDGCHGFHIANVIAESTSGSGTALQAIAFTAAGIQNLDVRDSYFTANTVGVIVDIQNQGVSGTFARNNIVSSATDSRALRVLTDNVGVFDNTIRVIGTGGVVGVNGDAWTHIYGGVPPIGGNRYINNTSPAKNLYGHQSSVVRYDEFFEGGYHREVNGPSGTQTIYARTDSFARAAFAPGGVGGGVTYNATYPLPNVNQYVIIPFAQGGGENGCQPGTLTWSVRNNLNDVSNPADDTLTVSVLNRCTLPQSVTGGFIASR